MCVEGLQVRQSLRRSRGTGDTSIVLLKPVYNLSTSSERNITRPQQTVGMVLIPLINGYGLGIILNILEYILSTANALSVLVSFVKLHHFNFPELSILSLLVYTQA